MTEPSESTPRHNHELNAMVRDWQAPNPGLKFTALMVATYMGMHDDEWSCYPGAERLARDTGYSPSTIRSHLADLEACGFLRREARGKPGGGRATSTLVFTLHEQTATEATFAPEQTATGTEANRDGDTDQTATGTGIAPLTRRTTEEPEKDEHAALVLALCLHLQQRVGGHLGAKPTITAQWRGDMDLLMRRGPKGVENPEPLTRERIIGAIDFTFDHLAERGTDGFCWADNIRSPGKLREKWIDLRLAYQRRFHQARAAQSPWDRAVAAAEQQATIIQIDRSQP